MSDVSDAEGADGAAAQPLRVDHFRVEHGDGLTVPVFTLPNRAAAGAPLVKFVLQRDLETTLYGSAGSGAVWKMLRDLGMGSTSLQCSSRAVSDGLIAQGEFDAILKTFKGKLADTDPCSIGRVRTCTLLPLSVAAACARTFGRRGSSKSKPMPMPPPACKISSSRKQLEQMEQQGFEAEEHSFAEELTTMAAFAPDQEDDERMKTYVLTRVPPVLRSELDAYVAYRTATFAARRQGGAVQSVSAESDCTSVLRFYGWLDRTARIPEGAFLHLDLLLRSDLGDIATDYVEFLENQQRIKYSSIANYLNGLVSLTTYAYANLEPADSVLNMEPNPLTQVINLRGQAEKASKQQQLYATSKVGGWLSWEDVQKTRVAAINKYNEALSSGSVAAQRNLLRDATALSLMSLIPPDRVGCIRRLRLSHTLKKKPSGGYMMDLSKQRDSHKTSRFYGPFAASLPAVLTPILDRYSAMLELEVGGDEAYLFHPHRTAPSIGRWRLTRSILKQAHTLTAHPNTHTHTPHTRGQV